jgi:hypothetical protein
MMQSLLVIHPFQLLAGWKFSPMMQSLLVIHPFQLLAEWKFSGPHITCITWKQHYKASLGILILSKTYPSKRKALPLIMHDFWFVGLFAKSY